MRLFAAIIPPEPVRAELSVVTAVAPGTSELEIAGVGSMQLPVTSFGNVTKRDFDQLMRTLVREAPRFPRRHRRFRPWLAIGTITEITSAPYLERLVAALDDSQVRSRISSSRKCRSAAAEHRTSLRPTRPSS